MTTTTWTDTQLKQANEAYTNAYYEGVFGEPHGILTLDKAEPIINAWIDMAVNEIEYQTGHTIDKYSLLEDLSGEDWKFFEITEDEEEAVDIDTVSSLIDAITDYYIRLFKEDDERESEIKHAPVGAKKPK